MKKVLKLGGGILKLVKKPFINPNNEKNEKIREKYANDPEFRKKCEARRLDYKTKNLKGSCYFCGKERDLDQHHLDYNKPLLVIDICRKCHNKLHALDKMKETL